MCNIEIGLTRFQFYFAGYMYRKRHTRPPARLSARPSMPLAPRYRTKTGYGITCGDIFRVNNALVQYDASGNPVVLNGNDPNVRTPYFKCPTLTNPTAGMTTMTNNTMITKKMRYAQLIRVATETKNVKKVYAVNGINRFGRWSGSPGGYGAPITNSF